MVEGKKAYISSYERIFRQQEVRYGPSVFRKLWLGERLFLLSSQFRLLVILSSNKFIVDGFHILSQVMNSSTVILEVEKSKTKSEGPK